MRSNSLILGVIALLAAGCASNHRQTAADPAAQPSATEDVSRQAAAGGAAGEPSAEEMAAWEKYMTPGPEHARMAAQEGSWLVTGKMWMGGPDAPAAETVGTAGFRMILGGRYQVQDYAATVAGMEFQGLAVTGFDNATKQYTSTWMDSLGTGTTTTHGTAAADGVLHFTGDMTDPNARTIRMREVLTEQDADTMVMEMYMSGGEFKREVKFMELTYKRIK